MNTIRIQHVKDYIEMLNAIEVLEYHNSNWLSWDKCYRNKAKRELLSEALTILTEEIKSDNVNEATSKF